jgi:hypothetical protein
MTAITHTTAGATGIGIPTGLPAGVTAAWASNTITISGTPTAAGTFNYSVPLSGGCATVNATGTITVSEPGSIILSSPAGTDDQSKNSNTIITPITYTTTGATGAAITGLPAGVTGSFVNNTVTITGTPTVSGTFNYSISLIGSCPTTITGRITASCEPIIGIIKINKESTVSYPFQFSSPTNGSSEACAETSFPIKYYASLSSLNVNSKLYSDTNLTIAINGGNLWYQNKINAISYKIDSTGKIVEIYTCSPSLPIIKSFWYKADDVVVNPEPNYLIYLDSEGIERRFDPWRDEGGNPCLEVKAVKIIRLHRVSPCTPQSYPFLFFSSGKTKSLFACNETNFPNRFYSDSPTIGMDVSLYLNESLTIPLTDGNLWYRPQGSPTSYKINNFGKVIEVSSCNSVPSDPGYAFGLSQGAGSSAFACSLNNNYSQTYYAATTTLGLGTQLYNDSSLTTTSQSDNSWYKLQYSNITFKINNYGVIDEVNLCENLRWFSFRPNNKIGDPGKDSVLYIDANDVQREHVLTRTASGAAPCESFYGKSIVQYFGATSCDLEN